MIKWCLTSKVKLIFDKSLLWCPLGWNNRWSCSWLARIDFRFRFDDVFVGHPVYQWRAPLWSSWPRTRTGTLSWCIVVGRGRGDLWWGAQRTTTFFSLKANLLLLRLSSSWSWPIHQQWFVVGDGTRGSLSVLRIVDGLTVVMIGVFVYVFLWVSFNIVLKEWW